MTEKLTLTSSAFARLNRPTHAACAAQQHIEYQSAEGCDKVFDVLYGYKYFNLSDCLI